MESKNPEIAVLLSTYNGEFFLDKQLKSIYGQKDVNVTLFVRDDQSNDMTLSILTKWSDIINIIFLESAGNLGPAMSFWEIVQNVSLDFDYYAFCDQDDIWDNDKLVTACTSMRDINEPCLYFCSERIIDIHDNIIDSGIKEEIVLTIESEIVCGFCPGCAMVVNRKLMRLVRGQTYPKLIMHDMVFIYNAFVLGRVIYDAEPHFSRRVHENNVVARTGKKRISILIERFHKLYTKRECKLDDFIKMFLENIIKYTEIKIDLDGLKKLAVYKKSLKNKFLILRDPRFISHNPKGLRSFKIKLLLGLL